MQVWVREREVGGDGKPISLSVIKLLPFSLFSDNNKAISIINDIYIYIYIFGVLNTVFKSLRIDTANPFLLICFRHLI